MKELECAKVQEPKKGSIFSLVTAYEKSESDVILLKFQIVEGINVFYFLTLKKQFLIDNPHILNRFKTEKITLEELDELKKL